MNPNVNDFDIKHYQEIYDNQYYQDDEDKEQFRNLGEEISGRNIFRIFVICLVILALSPLFTLDSYFETLSG